MTPVNGLYIALEGIDGTGKSTVSASLGELNPDWFITREPRRLDRTVLADGKLSPLADVLLFAADRVEQMREVSSLLSRGINVVSDRTFYSSMAYQATSLAEEFGSLELALDWVYGVNRPFLVCPDIVLLFDIPASVSLARVTGRGDKTRFEKEKYLEEVRTTYLLLAEKHDFHIIDASLPHEDVLKICIEELGL